MGGCGICKALRALSPSSFASLFPSILPSILLLPFCKSIAGSLVTCPQLSEDEHLAGGGSTFEGPS